MKQSTFTRSKFSIIAAVVLLGSITLYSCNDGSKKTEVTTTADTSKMVTPPVMQDTVMMKDTMPNKAVDTEKTEQAPPPRPH